MFPLSNGKLIRLNNDGTNGEIIHSKKTKMIFGTKILHDHFIKDIDPEKDVSCEISRDEYGRVSRRKTINATINDAQKMIFFCDFSMQKCCL